MSLVTASSRRAVLRQSVNSRIAPEHGANAYFCAAVASDRRALALLGELRGDGAPAGHTELLEYAGEVLLDGLAAHEEGGGDLVVGLALRDELRDLELAGAQSAGARALTASGAARNPAPQAAQLPRCLIAPGDRITGRQCAVGRVELGEGALALPRCL
jgi:hypothetical protein